MDKNTRQLAAQLRETTTRLVKKLRKQSLTGEKLSLTERSTIALLDQHGQLLPSELASMEKITTQSMSQILNHLLELGYINREPSKTDKRKVIISLSDAGREVLYRVRNEREEWLYTAISDLCTTEDRASLNNALSLLKKIIEHE
ncbi:MarR family transcriptional regulator [Mucilaginibacter roseus]|uniref:MarR family transcriptional regulator n=1 Tax=Mucilaginibacter roseus TaxID=1528868 RepID=A0ABS8U5J1_9SPHI|nr:MarR family transcriptional regulator [Mucilaginibacter roseus]MCD8741330.1 MarR family transcriptional regulator [Mucilaginibacter roseus]